MASKPRGCFIQIWLNEIVIIIAVCLFVCGLCVEYKHYRLSDDNNKIPTKLWTFLF